MRNGDHASTEPAKSGAASAKAVRCDGGWVLSGTKVWTSGAHLAHQIVVLARTSPLDPQRRHAGFSQFLVPTESAGISVSPIVLMTGEHHFNEIAFETTKPADQVLAALQKHDVIGGVRA